uniref:Uncharacterized protein n=1 Tax=Parascaris equorum TaxID=6256 RepID=A0A914RMH7_PAREQ
MVSSKFPTNLAENTDTRFGGVTFRPKIAFVTVPILAASHEPLTYFSVSNYESPRGRPKRPKPASDFKPGADMVEIFSELAKSKRMAEVSSIGTEPSTSNALVDEYRRTFCGHKKRFEIERKTIETRAQCFRMMQENDRQCKEHLALGEFLFETVF